MFRPLTFALLAGAFASPARAQELPLVAAYPMEKAGDVTPDAGPLQLDLKLRNATVVPGKIGQALRFDGRDAFAMLGAPQFDKLGSNFSVTLWAKIERFPQQGSTYIVQKGGNSGWQFGIGDRQQVMAHGSWGGGWYQTPWQGKIAQNTWTHIAFTMNKGDRLRLYLDGAEVTSDDAPFAFAPVGEAFKLAGGDFAGALDEVKIYAATLSPAQIKAEINGQVLPTRAATDADFPIAGYGVRMALARFDQPLGFAAYDYRQKQTAQKVQGPDAVDWPVLELEDGRKLFDKSGQTNVEIKLVKDAQAMPPTRQAWDHEIAPVNHWFRANEWRWGRSFVYTTDRTARSSSGDYEIWAFPIQIGDPNAPADARPIQRVELKLNGETIYQRAENLRSLTLLLPANLNGAPYELSVNGSAPARFDVGLQPLVPNAPRDVPLPVDVAIPGTQLRAQLALATSNANAREWNEDLKKMAAYQPAPDEATPAQGMKRWLGAGVPRAAVSTFTASMRAGMSGGHRFDSPHTVRFKGTPAEYAEHLANLGFDFVYETAKPDDLDRNRDLQTWARELGRRGVGFGLNPAIPGNLDILANPNLAFLSTYLPEWGAPAYRDAQLLGARFGKYPNFGGLMIGADNAGYVTYWDWAPTIPDRPWARAWEAHMRTNDLGDKVPVGPALNPSKVIEKRGSQREFMGYIQAYDKTFERYGYFARALREVAPHLSLTTGSYGSSPGVGARGGWPWATIPARPMHDAIPLLTAYDWNEQPSTKPMHLEALLDRLHSEYPDRPLQALVDDFGLLMTRETRQKSYALALTRGPKSIGTTFLAHPAQRADKVSTQDDQRELYGWIHRMGGAYAQMELQPTVGVLYVHQQAISRPIVGGENPSEAELLRGSHEGKTTEALFMAQAAGFPAVIVTPAELKRGLPASMKALLLVGLNRFDNTWIWSDGIEADLKRFAVGGGQLVRDDETVVPDGLDALAPGLAVRAYVIQSAQDQTQMLLDRNADNIAKLRAALAKVTVPLARSDEAQTWVVPTRAGDVDYLTIVNQAMQSAGAGATGRGEDIRVAGEQITDKLDADKYLVPAPRVAQIEMTAKTGVIYDARSQKKLTPAQAQNVDFTRDAFQLLAVAPRAIGAPRVSFAPAKNGFWSATVSVATPALRGVPVQLEISSGGETVTVYGASETPLLLPLSLGAATDARIVATENLSGQQTNATLQKPAQAAPAQAAPAQAGGDDAIRAFWARRVPLVIALTPAQMEDRVLGEKLVAWAKKSGRAARVAPLESIVTSLQPTRAIQRFPQWHTIEADLVLLGTPQNNVLIFDQARGGLLDESRAQQVTYSPFVGEFQALNLVGDAPSLAAQIAAVTR